MRAFMVAILASGLCLSQTAVFGDEQLWAIAPAESQVRIHVGKSGLFSAAGHTHEVLAPALSGQVRFDPEQIERAAIEITFDAKALKVSPEGEPPADVPKVQETMVSDRVLDVAKHPTIQFRSQQVAVESRNGGELRLRVGGMLTLRGVTRPAGGPVVVKLSADRVTGSGTLTVKQTDFGIEPVSAGLGTVKVKNEVTVTYTFTARRG
jgi:polyisoprenoid-binding protein YceI